MPNENYLMSEEEADKLDSVYPERQPPNGAAPPVPNAMPPYFQGSLPPTSQHDVSFVGTEVATPRIPKIALMPIPPQLNTITNAGIQSTAQKVVASSTPNVSIKLAAPKEIVVTGSPAGPTGAFNLAWASEPAGYVFATPNESFSAFVDSAQTVATRLPPADLFVGAGSSGPSEWAFGFNFENNDVTPAGWTALLGSGSANFTAWGQFFPAAGSVATYPIHVESGEAAVSSLVLFNTTGIVPVVNDFYTPTVSSPPFVFTNPTKAHDTVIVVLTNTPASTTDEPQGTITDSQGNTYFRLTSGSSTSWPAVLNESMAVYAAFDIVGGANTLSWLLATTTNMYVFVVTGIAAAPIIPRFIPASDVLSGSSVTSLNALTGALVLESSDSSITITPTTPNIDLTVPVMIGDTGSGGVQGLVPAPAAGDAAADKFLKADGTWDVPAGGGGGVAAAIEINSIGTATDKQIFINGVADGAGTVWGVSINSTPDGG